MIPKIFKMFIQTSRWALSPLEFLNNLKKIQDSHRRL